MSSLRCIYSIHPPEYYYIKKEKWNGGGGEKLSIFLFLLCLHEKHGDWISITAVNGMRWGAGTMWTMGKGCVPGKEMRAEGPLPSRRHHREVHTRCEVKGNDQKCRNICAVLCIEKLSVNWVELTIQKFLSISCRAN